MEVHRDLLKWNISHSSAKISITLTWTFVKQKEGILQRLQKTFKSLKSGGSESTMEDPIHHHFMRGQRGGGSFIEQRSHHRSPLIQSHSFCAPITRSSSVSPTKHQRSSVTAFSRSNTEEDQLCHDRQSGVMSLDLSPQTAPSAWSSLNRSQRVKAWTSSRSSWPNTPTHSHHSHRAKAFNPSSTSTPVKNSPAHSMSSSAHSYADMLTSHPGQWIGSARVSYRTDEEWDDNLRESYDIAQKRTQQKLELLKQDFDDTVKQWNRQGSRTPDDLTQSTNAASSRTSHVEVTSSTESLDSLPRCDVIDGEGYDAASGGSTCIRDADRTVKQCLKTCDNILTKHSTLIM